MKYIIIIFSVLICCSCENFNKRLPVKKSVIKREYRGTVKKVVEYHCDKYFNVNPLQIDKNSCRLFSVKEFNPKETLLKEMKWWKPDETDFKENKLNDSGLIIEQTFNLFRDTIKINYSYNKDGFLTEEVRYNQGVLELRVEYIYDEYNCEIKQIRYNERNEIRNYITTEYDNLNRYVSEVRYNEKNEPDSKWTYEYDEGDVPVIEYHYDGKGKLISKEDKKESYKTNKVDFLYSDGLPDKKFTNIEYYTNGKVKSWKFINQEDNDVYQTYDEKSRIIERKIYNKGQWKETHTWKYREDGLLIEESESTSKIVGRPYYKKTTYYRLDTVGNWIEKYILDSEGNITELVTRDIEYY